MPNETEVYTYDRTRRYEVKQGTRCASVQLRIPTRSQLVLNNLWTRAFYTKEATQQAALAWEKKWGEIPWDSVQILVTHVTMQVVVEFRVMED